MLRIGGLVASVILVADQISKQVVVEKMMDSPPIEVLPFLNLVMAWNRGISFGMFNTDGAWNAILLSGLSLIIVCGLVVWLRKVQSLRMAVGLGAIIGGALGNVVDRARWRAVADFIDVHAFGYHWPAFNVADSAISIGAVILILDALFSHREQAINRDHDSHS